MRVVEEVKEDNSGGIGGGQNVASRDQLNCSGGMIL